MKLYIFIQICSWSIFDIVESTYCPKYELELKSRGILTIRIELKQVFFLARGCGTIYLLNERSVRHRMNLGEKWKFWKEKTSLANFYIHLKLIG